MTSLGGAPSSFSTVVLWLPMENGGGEMGKGGGKVALVVSKIFYFLMKETERERWTTLQTKTAKYQLPLNLGCESQDLFYFSVCLEGFSVKVLKIKKPRGDYCEVR